MNEIKEMSRDEMIDIFISQINEQAERELERLAFWIENADTEDELCELWEEKLKIKYVQRIFSDKELYNATYSNGHLMVDDYDVYLWIHRTLSHIHQLTDAIEISCWYQNPHNLAFHYISIIEKIAIEKMLKDKEELK